MAVTYLPFDADPIIAIVGQVRGLIKDKQGAQFDDDDDLKIFIATEGGVEAFGIAKLVAAAALLSIAGSQTLKQKRIKTLALETDGPALGKELREQAKELRAQVKEARLEAENEAAALDAHEFGVFDLGDFP